MKKTAFRALWLVLLAPLAVASLILWLASLLRSDGAHYRDVALGDLGDWWRAFKLGGL